MLIALSNTAILRIPQQPVIAELDDFAGQITTRSLQCSHYHPIQEQRGKVGLLQLPGITLISIAGKFLARILLNWLVPIIAKNHLLDSQCGFRAMLNCDVATSNPDQNFTCCHCKQTCLSDIGLSSHEHTCSGRGSPLHNLHSRSQAMIMSKNIKRMLRAQRTNRHLSHTTSMTQA